MGPLNRSILAFASVTALLLTSTSCDSWFGPAEGDGIRGVTPSTIEVVAGSNCCGGKARLDNGPIVNFTGSHQFSNLSAGPHTIASKSCYGSCSGGILGGGPGCQCGEWTYCTINIHQGGYVVVQAGGYTCN